MGLVYLIIALFVGLFFVQMYFRFRVLKVYQRLTRNQVQFEAKHIFSKRKLEEEVLPRYPEHREDILRFVKEMQLSVTFASIFIVLIFIVGFIIRS